ncbi:alpha/beta-hydrolase [Heliocybe sulcata]|uniref:Alpha/beta-hydrolase n=1 Tax=Heliocybe sulcata TaxID=5364 RepID=A0A5C3NG15_9AGAM|nr:alpha/beta-hydrolase [Heliocybe sulcata]
MYLQGNAGSPLHRLPVFSTLLTSRPSLHPLPSSTRVVAVGPRSYWKSPGRATEHGITTDYRATLDHITRQWPRSPVILYGHSLGGAAAVCLLARLKTQEYPNVSGLVLENPFASIPAMVKALYPSPWTPYHHLGNFAFDKWDAVAAMRESHEDSVLQSVMRDVLVLVSEHDEVVPRQMGESLYELSQRGRGMDGIGRLAVIDGALHENAWTKREWLREVRRYVNAIVESKSARCQ